MKTILKNKKNTLKKISIGTIFGILMISSVFALNVDGNNAIWLFYVANQNDNHVEYYALTESTTDCSFVDDDDDTLYNRWHNTNYIEDDKPEYEDVAWFEEFVYGFGDVRVIQNTSTQSVIEFIVEAFEEVDELDGVPIRATITRNSQGQCQAQTTMNLNNTNYQVERAQIYLNEDDDYCFELVTSSGQSFHFCD